MKVNMNKNAVASTRTPIKYEMERDSGGTVTTDLLTLAGNVQFTGNILNNVLLKRAGTAIFDVNNSLTSAVDKQSILRMTNNEARLDQNLYQYNANDSIEYNISANMNRFGINTSRIPLKYELQRNGAQVVTKDMITITSNFLPPVKSNALSRSGLQTLNMGTSTDWNYITSLTPGTIEKTSDFTNCFGTADGYGFKYTGTRQLRCLVIISISYYTSITTGIQFLVSHMLGAGGGYDLQVTNIMKSGTTNTEYQSCTLQGIIEIKTNDIIRLLTAKTNNIDGTLYFYCNFSIATV